MVATMVAKKVERISETTGRMTMKFLPDVKLIEEALNQKKIGHSLAGLHRGSLLSFLSSLLL